MNTKPDDECTVDDIDASSQDAFYMETSENSLEEADKSPIFKKLKEKMQQVKKRDSSLTIKNNKKSVKIQQKKKVPASGKKYVKRNKSISKEKHLLPNPCKSMKCANKCGGITEEKRKSIFDQYWGLSSQARKSWLASMTLRMDIKRKRSKNSTYRQNTFEYYIPDGNGRHQVCLQFLVNTLNVSQRSVHYTVANEFIPAANSDTRAKRVPANKTPVSIKKSAVNFIKSLPALTSRYCTKGSQRLYLPSEFKSINKLYRIYKEDFVKKGVKIVNEKIFRNIINNDFDLGFHVPKRDKCMICLKHGVRNTPDSKFTLHLQEIEASKSRYNHCDLGKNDLTSLCTSFKLQKVLNTPYGNNQLLYYVRKYSVNNLCFYESVTKKGFCYMWGETEGNRSNSEIATIVHKYIDDIDQRKTIKDLILYTDPCPGQNQNKILLSAIHNALMLSKHLQTIQINIMILGHTEMTVDSIHSTIEHSIRNVTIWAPSQWYTVLQLARKEPSPYEVQSLTHEDFNNFNDLPETNFQKITARKINEIRIATFNKSTPDTMTVKYSMKNDATEDIIPMISIPLALSSKYKTRLPITRSKFNDLKKLCDGDVIPKIFHAEYFNFPTYSGKDVLIDSDIEDEVIDNKLVKS